MTHPPDDNPSAVGSEQWRGSPEVIFANWREMLHLQPLERPRTTRACRAEVRRRRKRF
jgi:hypothetical protein